MRCKICGKLMVKVKECTGDYCKISFKCEDCNK